MAAAVVRQVVLLQVLEEHMEEQAETMVIMAQREQIPQVWI